MICQDQRFFSRRNHWLTRSLGSVSFQLFPARSIVMWLSQLFSPTAAAAFPYHQLVKEKKNPERSSFKCIILGLPTFLPRTTSSKICNWHTACHLSKELFQSSFFFRLPNRQLFPAARTISFLFFLVYLELTSGKTSVKNYAELWFEQRQCPA